MSKKQEAVAAAPVQEVVPQETQALAVAPEEAVQEILTGDILIPRILLQQGLSEFVTERKKCSITGRPIGLGDLVRSTTLEIVGDPDKPVQVVPLKMVNSWRNEELVNGKFEFRGQEPRNAANEDLPWDYIKNSVECRRQKVIELYCLLPADIAAYNLEMKKFLDTGEMPDMNRTLMPVVFSFKSMSFNAGKKVATFYAQLRDMARFSADIRGYQYTLDISCHADKNDKGSFFVLDVGATKKLDPAYVAEAQRWSAILNAMKVIRVDAEEKEYEVPAAAAQSTPPRGAQSNRF